MAKKERRDRESKAVNFKLLQMEKQSNPIEMDKSVIREETI
jgi:hypothetical protein